LAGCPALFAGRSAARGAGTPQISTHLGRNLPISGASPTAQELAHALRRLARRVFEGIFSPPELHAMKRKNCNK